MSKQIPNICHAHTIRRASFVCFAVLLTIFAPAHAQHMQPTPAMSAYFNMLYAGDLSGAAAMFEENAEDAMAARMSAQFDERFVRRTSGLDLSGVKSEKVRAVLMLYQDYWRDTLMQVAPREEIEETFYGELEKALGTEGFASAPADEDAMQAAVETFMVNNGVYAQAGRTPPLQDLIVWTSNDTALTSVELTDNTHEVQINFMDDFVSFGWLNFGSFGMTRAGGWAEKDGLYCVCSSYDMTSERYLVSFLKHETRHHVDMALYPELGSPDLEYRAKLTELAFADEELYALLGQFTSGANKLVDAPHPLANWHVVDGLSRLLRDGDHPADASDWITVSKKRIQSAARQLLIDHDQQLEKAGPTTTEGIITK